MDTTPAERIERLTDPASVFDGFGSLGQPPITGPVVTIEAFEDGRAVFATATVDGRVVLAVVYVEVDGDEVPQRHVSFVHLTASTLLELMELVPNTAPAPLTDDSVIGRILDNDPEG